MIDNETASFPSSNEVYVSSNRKPYGHGYSQRRGVSHNEHLFVMLSVTCQYRLLLIFTFIRRVLHLIQCTIHWLLVLVFVRHDELYTWYMYDTTWILGMTFDRHDEPYMATRFDVCPSIALPYYSHWRLSGMLSSTRKYMATPIYVCPL